MDLPPESRVRAFIADFHSMWQRLYPSVSETGEIVAWREACEPIQAAHFAEGTLASSWNQPRSPSPHDPAFEEIVDQRVDGDRAVVLTKRPPYGFFEYTLGRIDAEWRIVRLDSYVADPNERLVPEAELAEHLAAASAESALRAVPEAEQHRATHALSEAGREVTSGDRTEALVVRPVGALDVASGVLAIMDLGYGRRDLEPLTRRVPCGRHPVDVSTAFGVNAGLRVRFGDPASVVAWHPADSRSGGHVSGSDYANLAIFDLASFGTLTRRAKERLYDEAVLEPEGAFVSFITMSRPSDGVVAHSGWGDGAYPAYWGVDAQGSPVVLVIDFVVV